MILGALEMGGTKMVLAIGNENGEIFEKNVIPCKNPDETLKDIADYFKSRNIEALGIGSFGPLCLDRTKEKYGYITSTPKPGWADTNVKGFLEQKLGCPAGFDTDVNAAALGEATFGDSRGIKDMIYVTVGTGIGVGVLINGQLLHGMTHPEAGHISVRIHPSDSFDGNCPYHRNCLEGMASGPAIYKRYGTQGETICANDKAWEIESFYLAQGIVNWCMCYSPKRIVVGGGVFEKEGLIQRVRKDFVSLMNGYVLSDEMNDIDSFIIKSSLEGNQGIMGCFRLAYIEKEPA